MLSIRKSISRQSTQQEKYVYHADVLSFVQKVRKLFVAMELSSFSIKHSFQRIMELLVNLGVWKAMLETCSSKQSLSSTVIPNNAIDFCTGKENTWSVFPIIMTWCLMGLTNVPLLLYHSFAILSWCVSLLSSNLGSVSESNNCSSSAYAWSFTSVI